MVDSAETVTAQLRAGDQPRTASATPGEAALQRTVAQFLQVQQSAGARGTVARTAAGKRRHHHHRLTRMESVAPLGRQEALNAVNQHVHVFPIYYPGRLAPGGTFADQPRVYSIITRDGKHYAAYRMVFSAGFVGQYVSDWNLIFAALVISILPILLIYFALQRSIINGFAGGLRG